MADDFIFDINAYVQGNNGNILPVTIRNKGAVVNITGATVRVAIKQGAYISTKQAVITDAANGKCEITLTREDLATAGLYYYQPTITYADDREFSGDVEKFRVSGKLAGAPPVITPGMIELSRLGINAGGKLTIDGVEQIGGTGGGTILFEDWVGGETVTIDTSTTPAPDTTAPVLTITPNGGTFAATQGVTMTTNETATIYYTLDGSTPTVSSAVYSTALSLNATTTLKAFAKDTAGNSSAVQTVTFTKDAAAPADTTAPVLTMTPAATFADTQTVTMSANETATIYYTLDDTDPKVSATKLTYTAPLTLTATDTVKAYAVDSVGNESAVQTVTYTKQAVSSLQTVYFINPTDRPTTSASNGWKTGAFLNKQAVSLEEIDCGGNLADKAWQLWSVDSAAWTLGTQLASGVFATSLEADANGVSYAKHVLTTPISLVAGSHYAISVNNSLSGSNMLYSNNSLQRVNDEWIDNSLARYASTTPTTGLALVTNFVYDFKIKVSL